MKQRASRLALACAVMCLLYGSVTLAARTPVPSPPPVGGTSYILLDHHSKRVLAAENADHRIEPASLTKLMTAYIAFSALRDGNISLDDEIVISEKAWRMPGSRMFIEVNSRVSLEELLQGMIIQSGNDASVAIAEHVAGSEEAFVQMMNAAAQQLGLENTQFANSTGLGHSEQRTTAHDIARLASSLIREFPEHYGWYAVREYTYNGIRQHNRNRLLWRDSSVDGLKTGYTESAGYNLAASAQRDDTRLISVVTGTRNDEARASASYALLNYGFRFFQTHRLYSAGEELTRARVWRGARDEVALGLREDLYVTIPRGQYDDLDAYMDLESAVLAPIGPDRETGRVQVTLGGETIADKALFPLQEVGEGGFFRRVLDDVRLWFK